MKLRFAYFFSTNAFELISLTGALDLTALLTPKRHHYTRFVSTNSCDEIVEKFSVVFSQLKIPFKSNQSPKKMKVDDPATGICFFIKIRGLPGDKQLVELDRQSGDAIAFLDLYAKIEELCEDIVYKDAFAHHS